MNPEELLNKATAEFEATFSQVKTAEPGRYFDHVDGTRHEYLEIASGGLRMQGQSYPDHWHDTPEEAVSAWKVTVKPFEGKEFLYWRVRPEIDQSRLENLWGDAPGKMRPNPCFGKWAVYSRFRVLP